MYKTAVYTRANGDVQQMQMTHLKEHKSRAVILLKQHLANVSVRASTS